MIHIAGVVPEIGTISILGTARDRKVVEVSLERPWKDEFKPVSFM